MIGEVPGQQVFAGGEQVIAIDQGPQHQMVRVGDKNQRDGGYVQKLVINWLCCSVIGSKVNILVSPTA